MNANKTVKQFSWGKAVVFLILVSLFYLASGLGELLESIIQEEGIKGGGLAVDQYFFAHLYWKYLFYLSWITMITGILLLFRLNFARVAAIAIAWWNIFTGPLIDVWRQMFYMKINKLVIVDTEKVDVL